VKGENCKKETAYIRVTEKERKKGREIKGRRNKERKEDKALNWKNYSHFENLRKYGTYFFLTEIVNRVNIRSRKVVLFFWL
jgi:hypothetical protein